MNRRTLLLALIATPVAANAGFLSDIKDAITGHASDIKGRLTGEHMLIGGKTLLSGEFDEDAVGQDAAHWATGNVKIQFADGKKYIQLATNFASGPLPDGHVYFSEKKDINDENDFNDSVQFDAGKLIRGIGATYYEIPLDAKVGSVTIWCKRFGAYIGSADLMEI